MKKTVIIGLVLLILGAAVFGLGYAGANGDFSVLSGSVGPLRVNIGNGDFAITARDGFGGGKGSGESAAPRITDRASGDRETVSYDFEAAERVIVEEDCAAVTVGVSPDSGIHVTASERSDYRCQCTLSGNTLRIKRESSVHTPLSAEDIQLEILLPANTFCSLDLENDCGAVTAEGLYFKTLQLDTDVGSIELKNVRADTLEVSVDVGGISMENVSVRKSSSLSTDVGSIELDNFFGGEKTELETDTGSISAALTGSASDYTVTTRTSGRENTVSGGRNSVWAETDLGEIDIRFTE